MSTVADLYEASARIIGARTGTILSGSATSAVLGGLVGTTGLRSVLHQSTFRCHPFSATGAAFAIAIDGVPRVLRRELVASLAVGLAGVDCGGCHMTRQGVLSTSPEPEVIQIHATSMLAGRATLARQVVVVAEMVEH